SERRAGRAVDFAPLIHASPDVPRVGPTPAARCAIRSEVLTMILSSAVPSMRRAGGSAARAGLALETVGISKHFGAHIALEDVSIKVRAGTIHALLGENGAGKSTLVKCIMGEHRPTRGQILLDNREVTIDGIRDAHRRGMGMVYQHFTLVPS